MSEFQIMIPEAADLPAHIINLELARKANEDAAAGVGTGFPPRLKMSGKQFAVVDGNGVETAIKLKELVEGPDENSYLKTVVLAAKKQLQKRFYLTKYDPSKDGVAPDCFSNDGERPDATIPTPQCDTCAGCQYNAFGSGTNENGAATNGKACTDNKIVAVHLPGKGAHELKITPASLKNWGLFVKTLSSRGVLIGNIFTLVGFDPTASFPVLTFQYGGAIPAAGIEKLAALSQTPEVLEIVNQRMTFSTKVAPAAAGKVADINTAAEKKKADAVKKAAAEAKKKSDAEKLAAASADDGLGLSDEVEEPAAAVADLGADISDDDLANELGL
jgi:hypothetical protein